MEKYKEFRDTMIEKPFKNKKQETKQNIVLSSKVLSVSPFIYEFQDYDSYHILPGLTASRDPIFHSYPYLDEDADLGKFKHLEKYGLIIIDSHGRRLSKNAPYIINSYSPNDAVWYPTD